jgi:sodium transport system permease protein
VSLRIVGIIYLKELRDMLRDRRTLMSMIVVPTFVMPAALLAATRVVTAVTRQARAEVPRVMVIGGADSPGVRKGLERTGKFRLEDASADWRRLISDKRVRAAVEIPPGFEKALSAGDAPTITLYGYQGEMKSGLAQEQLDSFFTKLRTRTTVALLAGRGLPPTVARPFEVREVNVAPPEKVGGNLFGGIVPYFIVILCLIGAMYPAIDLTAGEKERGTMETLLCSPAGRTDIVLGKFLMILTASLTAVALSLLSLVGTLLVLGATVGTGSAGSAAGSVSIDPVGLLGVLALVVPVAVLFSACVFTIALFAKSLKEAQGYLTPLTFLVILPSGIGLIPGVDLSLPLSFVPIVNVSLVCKEMLSGVWHWGYIAIIFGSTAAYAAAALAMAVAMFRREGVIFRT